jgi:predicted TIM-barrel enzyme
LTADVSIAETAQAAAFCGADGVIVSGTATGRAVAVEDVREARLAVELPVAIGSGLTPENLPGLWDWADLFIVGSYLKQDGLWHNPPDPDRVAAMMRAAERLRPSEPAAQATDHAGPR